MFTFEMLCSPPEPQVESSLAFYDKVVDIWYKFLASVRNDTSLAENVGKVQLSEGMDMLARVLSTRVNLLGDTHIATVSEGVDYVTLPFNLLSHVSY